jgi:hypothetical protein
MKRTIALAVLVAAVIGVGAGTAGAAKTVKASAKFTVQLADQSGSYDFTQSRVTKSTLEGTRQVPVSLHASPKSNPIQEFVLAGRVKKGTQPTSEAVALGLSVDIGGQSMLLNSTDGGCTVNITKLTKSRVTGSFTCDTTYADQPVHAEGTFKAR